MNGLDGGGTHRARASRGWRRRLAAVLVAAAAAVWMGEAAPAHGLADPFYVDRLRDGMQSYARGDYAAAAKQLQVACFGMLDDPDQLAACLTRLAVAQGAAGNNEGFRDTFRRLVEVEDRFGAYSRADLPADIRGAFEQRALAVMPPAVLTAIPQFKDLLNRKVEAQLAALPPRERRHELEERLAKEPKSAVWNEMMIELDLAEGRGAAAAARAEQLAAGAPQDARAACLRGLAHAAENRCKDAVPDLEPCYLCTREPDYAAALLGCRIALGAWVQAAAQAQALPAAWRSDRRLAPLIQQVAKHDTAAAAAQRRGAAGAAPGVVGAPGAAGGAPTGAGSAPNGAAASPVVGRRADGARSASAAPGTPPGTAGTPAADPRTGAAGTPGATGAGAPPERPLSATEREAMARSAKLLTASDSPDLKEAMRLARQVADAHPDSREAQYLAGEAAYRNARWPDAATYFRRGGLPGDDHPELLFYMAVALYEVGDQPAAATALRRSLPNLQRTPYVQGYVKRILGE